MLTIRELRGKSALRDWLGVPGRIYGGDANYVEQLHFSERERISRKHNPLFSYGDAEFFLAYAGDRPVGRISAQINNMHLAQHSDKTGQFGFFDCVQDPAVARRLVEAAASWLRARGMQHMCGPFNLTINQDSGLLVSGFSTPPAILTGHAAPWTGALLEQCGLSKAIDLFAYRIKPDRPTPEIERLAKLAKGSGRIRIRNVDMRRFSQEAQLIFDIFNDAWSDNWGFVPAGSEDVRAIVRDMRPIMRGKFGLVAEIDGEPAAMLIVLPDLNRVIAPFGGKLLPLNWLKLAYEIYADRWKTARIPLLGIRKVHRTSPLAAGVLSLLVSETLKLGRVYDLDWVEFSWILETNRSMVNLATIAAGPPAKVYRVYKGDVSRNA